MPVLVATSPTGQLYATGEAQRTGRNGYVDFTAGLAHRLQFASTLVSCWLRRLINSFLRIIERASDFPSGVIQGCEQNVRGGLAELLLKPIAGASQHSSDATE